MKFSWTSFKISIAGAKLSHLAQKDKIWDHGSMTEQARIIFYLVSKAKANENVELVKKQCSVSCFEKLKTEFGRKEKEKSSLITNPLVKEIAITDVQPGKNNKPDMFNVLIKGISKENSSKTFAAKWSFIRQGDWWILDEVR